MGRWGGLCLLVISTASYCGCNLLKSGGFEDNADWRRNVRCKSNWDFQIAPQSQISTGPCERCPDGKALHYIDMEDCKELVASQYIPEERISTSPVGKLGRIKATVTNLPSDGSFEFHLDVSYDDESYLLVVHEISALETQETCLLVPQYGTIRAMMVHFVVKDKIANTLSLDSASVEIVEDLSQHQHCLAYLRSRPKQRQILLNYLYPATAPQRRMDITLVTQLTEDRFDLLEETAKFWQGPISAALLVFKAGEEETLKRVKEKYQTSEHLRNFATFHVVFEDLVMNEDHKVYPVNFLRKVVMNQTSTEYLFYVDADITPVFSHDDAIQWLQEAKRLDHKQCAFIAPLFMHSRKETNPVIPTTKRALLEDYEASRIEPFLVKSHNAVDYWTWYKSDRMYKIKYSLDMEPYFITHWEAPLVNEMFAGYGRDKCAYSKELHHAGFKFHVLPFAFLINRKEPPNSKTIFHRSGTIGLRIFLTTMFHDEDLKRGFLRRRVEKHRPLAQDESCDRTDQTCGPKSGQDSSIYKADANTDTEMFPDEANEEETEDGGLKCENLPGSLIGGELFAQTIKPMPNLVLNPKNVVESLIKFFFIGNVVFLPTELRGPIALLIPYAHPENVINVMPNAPKTAFAQPNSDLFTEYRSFLNSTNVLLKEVRKKFTAPVLYWLDLTDLNESEASENISATLEYSSNKDVIVISTNNLRPAVIAQEMCARKKSWKLYMNDAYYLMKSSHFTPPHPVVHPKLDMSKLTIKDNQIDLSSCPNIKTDVILFSKNRPLQTHAFVESLLQMVSGIGKLWIIASSDHDDVVKGYEQVENCFFDNVLLEILYDKNEGFGRTLDGVFQRSDADYVVLAVDEIIWLRPVDLSASACFLHTLGDQVETFQLRLGDNLNFPHNMKISEDQKVLLGRIGQEEIFAYYPLWQPFDAGYITHVDGPLLSLKRLHNEWASWIQDVRDPGKLESLWLRKSMHKYARTWHLMYSKSRLVNNKVGDRVARSGMLQSSLDLLNVYLDQQRVIDVSKFRAEHLEHQSTHISDNVNYKDISCS